MRHPDRVAIRRQEVAALAADGVSCRAIARELGISPSTASRDLRALAAVSGPPSPGGGTPGESVAARYVAPGAAAGVSYASVAERLSEIDRLLSEWRERASSQTPAAALFARLLKARHDLAASECAGHVAAAALDDLASTINIAWGDSLRQAQREFQTAGLDLDANPILQRVLDTTRRALGGM